MIKCSICAQMLFFLLVKSHFFYKFLLIFLWNVAVNESLMTFVSLI